MLHNLPFMRNISAKEMSILAPVIFNKLNSVRIHLEAILEDIKELQSAVSDMVDVDGEITTATFRTPTTEQVNVSSLDGDINIINNGNDNTRDSGYDTVHTPTIREVK